MDLKIVQVPATDLSSPLYLSLCRLKYDILVQEQQKTVDHCDHRQRLVMDELDQHAVILVALKGDEVAGSIRLNFPGDHPTDYSLLKDAYRLDLFKDTGILSETFTVTRFLVATPYRNSRVAFQLVTAATAYTYTMLHKTLSIVGSTAAIYRFHSRLGYRRYTAEPVLFSEGMYVYPMVADLGNTQSLEAVRSPLVPLLGEKQKQIPGISSIVDGFVQRSPQLIT